MTTELNKTVIIFSDVCRSTQLFEIYGDVKAREIVGGAVKLMGDVVRRNGGEVIKTIGDEVMCVVDSPDRAVMACGEMQNLIKTDAMLSEYRVGIKTGLHYGEVIEEGGDVFGDAVNVAARMVGSAKRDQIVTTKVTIDSLSPMMNKKTRSLGVTKIRGKAEPVQLIEILWQEDSANLTTVSRAIGAEDLLSKQQLTLRFMENVFTILDTTHGYALGRDVHSDIVMDEEWVSRNHAAIEFRKRSFVLVDRSTNGTYVSIAEEEPFLVHRDEMQLRKSGIISLGQEIVPGGPLLLYFQCSGP